MLFWSLFLAKVHETGAHFRSKIPTPEPKFGFWAKKMGYARNGHLPQNGWTFGPLGPKGIRKKKTHPKKALLRGQEVLILGLAKKEPRTARGHFETGSRIKWSIGAPQTGTLKKSLFWVFPKVAVLPYFCLETGFGQNRLPEPFWTLRRSSFDRSALPQ